MRVIEARHELLNRLRQTQAGQQLLVVSNREPYAHRRGKAGRVVEKPAGGLVTALDPVMQEVAGTWIAWGDGEADFEVTDDRGCVAVPPENPRYTLKRVALDRAEVDGSYYGYANRALWPLCHMAMEQARFRDSFWSAYQNVNRRFAEATADEARADALVWIHDYHLALCPRFLRRLRPELFLMHFWHVPWPAWDVFRICPQRAELLDGLLANDLMVFQHPRHAQHFLECVEREIGARIADGVVEHQGRMTVVEAFPISVDVAALDHAASSRNCDRWITRLRRRLRLQDRSVVVSVDRLDYTKGIPERLRAIDLFFKRWPEYRSRVVFIQKTAPSRTRIKAYRDLQARVQDAVDKLNAAHGTDDWQPVISLPTPLPAAGMAALYRMADLCIVSSLQDGMNLVAKEFVACQVDQRGALLLSELTGARDELSWAIPINPYDAEGCATAIADGLAMDREERGRRMAHLRAYLAEHDIFSWMAQHIEAATHLRNARQAPRRLPDAIDEVQAQTDGRPLAFLADFDGTLAEFADDPNAVTLPAAVKDSLTRLSRRSALVAIISGRSLGDIRRRVDIAGLVYAGNHGLEIAGPGWTWTHPAAVKAQEAVAACCRRLRQALRGIPGAWVEDKGLTATVHYRLTPHRFVDRVSVAVREDVARLPTGTLAVHPGKHILEIRPEVPWDKGTAARWILSRMLGPGALEQACVIYAGDDRTDEDVFDALPDPSVTIKVGGHAQPTAARYSLRGADEVARFIDFVEARAVAASPSAPGSPHAGLPVAVHG